MCGNVEGSSETQEDKKRESPEDKSETLSEAPEHISKTLEDKVPENFFVVLVP